MAQINKQEYENYIRSGSWMEKRRQRLAMDNNTCVVCGKPATQVHHLTYERFKAESMDDLVSLCDDCHQEAEKLFQEAEQKPLFTERVTSSGNFMAAMRVDAQRVAPLVYDYLTKVKGNDFKSILSLKRPSSPQRRDAWQTMERAVDALCRRRYEVYTDDRRNIAIDMITSHTMVLTCLGAIKHENRNEIQAFLHDVVNGMKETCRTWKATAENLGVSTSSLSNIRKDNGSNSGPTLRESVFYFCGFDALAGIKPDEQFKCCLMPEDFETLNSLADYAVRTSGIEYLAGTGGAEC